MGKGAADVRDGNGTTDGESDWKRSVANGQTTANRIFLRNMWQAKDLQAHFLDVWEILRS